MYEAETLLYLQVLMASPEPVWIDPDDELIDPDDELFHRPVKEMSDEDFTRRLNLFHVSWRNQLSPPYDPEYTADVARWEQRRRLRLVS